MRREKVGQEEGTRLRGAYRLLLFFSSRAEVDMTNIVKLNLESAKYANWTPKIFFNIKVKTFKSEI